MNKRFHYACYTGWCLFNGLFLCTVYGFVCVCLCGWIWCVCVCQWGAWVGTCTHRNQKHLWIINTPLAADERVPARSALTFRGPVSLRFKDTCTRSHFLYLWSSSAWSRDELVSLDRCTFPWHRRHAGSHLIYTTSSGTEASLTSFIFPMPCRHPLLLYPHTCKHAAIS